MKKKNRSEPTLRCCFPFSASSSSRPPVVSYFFSWSSLSRPSFSSSSSVLLFVSTVLPLLFVLPLCGPYFTTHPWDSRFTSPSRHAPPRIFRRARLSRPHPFGKGRGGCGCHLRASWGAEGWAHIPHIKGGLVAGPLRVVGVGVARMVVVVNWDDEPKSTVMRLMAALNSASPQR